MYGAKIGDGMLQLLGRSAEIPAFYIQFGPGMAQIQNCCGAGRTRRPAADRGAFLVHGPEGGTLIPVGLAKVNYCEVIDRLGTSSNTEIALASRAVSEWAIPPSNQILGITCCQPFRGTVQLHRERPKRSTG